MTWIPARLLPSRRCAAALALVAACVLESAALLAACESGGGAFGRPSAYGGEGGAAGAGGAGGQGGWSCGPGFELPDAITFTCEAGPPDAYGCPNPTDYPSMQDAGEPDARYSTGCKVLYPFENYFYPCEVASCDCTVWDEPEWDCPL